MLEEIKSRANMLTHMLDSMDKLKEKDIINITTNIVWIIQNCTVPKLRYYSAINSALEALYKLYKTHGLGTIRKILLSILRKSLGKVLVIIVRPRPDDISYDFALRGGAIDPKSILETINELCFSLLGSCKRGPSKASIRIAIAYVYTLIIIIIAGIRDRRKNIPRRLIKNINILLREIFDKYSERISLFDEAIGRIIKCTQNSSGWRDLSLVSEIAYRINHNAKILVSSVSHEALRETDIKELSIDEFRVELEDGYIDKRTMLYRLLKNVESIGRRMAVVVENNLSLWSMEMSKSTRVFLSNIIGYFKNLIKPEIAVSLNQNFSEIIRDISRSHKLQQIISIFLSIILMRQTIMKALFTDDFLFYSTDERTKSGEKMLLQIICFGDDLILKNILEFPIYHTDGHRYSAFSYGLGVLDINPKASRVLVLRYMYPMKHDKIDGIKVERETTLYDLYNENLSIPWIEMCISRIAGQRTSIYLRRSDRKNIYEGHIEFSLSPRRVPILTPGKLTLTAFMLLTSPVYEKILNDGITIEELSIEIRYLGAQDIYEPLILPKLCNNILHLLQNALHKGIRKIIVLTTLAEEIRVRLLVRRNNENSIIHIDILPLILERSGERIYGTPMSASDTLAHYISKYRLELVDYIEHLE